MKLTKNVNLNSVVARLEQIAQEANTLAKAFKDAIQVFDNQKLGVTELNYQIDEELARFNNTHAKINEIIRSL